MLFFSSSGLMAQSRRVAGNVKAADGRTIEAVTVTNLKTGVAVVTAPNGTFTIDADASDTLEFSGVGYQVYRQLAGDVNITAVLAVNSA